MDLPGNGSPFFKRVWRVVVGVESSLGEGYAKALDVSNLDCDWSVSKSIKPAPNSCELTIFNLPEAARSALEALNKYDPKKTKGEKDKKKKEKKAENGHRAPKSGRIRVEITAGYEDVGFALIFRGDLRRAISERLGDGSWQTKISGEDGGRSVLTSRVRRSYPPGTTHYTVVSDCAYAMGVGLGNIDMVKSPLLGKVFTHGTVLDGSASKELAGILRIDKLAYSIQNGALNFRPTGRPDFTRAVYLSESSGMVGSPSRESTGTIRVKTLLNPSISCGTYVKLVSIQYNGTYVVASVKYDCSTYGSSWYQDIELVAG